MENQNNKSTSSTPQTKSAAPKQRKSAQEDSSSMNSESREASTQNSGSEQKSVGSVIAQSLAKESQESIDNVLGQVQDTFKSTTDYVAENTREALLIAAAAGLSAYVLLATKPGRKVFDAGAERFIPEITKWISSTFNTRNSDVH